MSGAQPINPVVLVKSRDYLGVDRLAGTILQDGIFFYPLIFVNPSVSKTDFEPQATKLHNMVLDPKSDSDELIAQSMIVHGMLTLLCLYAKIICNHNVELIKKSGFPLNHQPVKAVPVKITGKVTVVKGKVAGTYQAKISKKSNKKAVEPDPATHQKGALYSVQLSTTPDDQNSWVTVCESKPSTKLIFLASAVTLGKRNWIRIYGVNSAGKGNPSDPTPFTPDIE